MLSLVCKSSDPAPLEEVLPRCLCPAARQGVSPDTDADVGRHGGLITSETVGRPGSPGGYLIAQNL